MIKRTDSSERKIEEYKSIINAVEQELSSLRARWQSGELRQEEYEPMHDALVGVICQYNTNIEHEEAIIKEKSLVS